MSGDAKIKAAVQEILEVVRKYDLAAFIVVQGRELQEIRTRVPTWSALELSEDPQGVQMQFRTRKGGTGERRPQKDIDDSLNILRGFAQSIATNGYQMLQFLEQVIKKIEAAGGKVDMQDGFNGGIPRWDLL